MKKICLTPTMFRLTVTILIAITSLVARGDDVVVNVRVNKDTTLVSRIELSESNTNTSARKGIKKDSGQPSSPASSSLPLPADAKKEQAINLLSNYRSAVLGANPNAQLVFRKYQAEERALGEYFDFEQKINNVAVAGGQFRVHFDNNTMRLADGATLRLNSGFNTSYLRDSSQITQIVNEWARNTFDTEPHVASVTPYIFNKGFYLHRTPDNDTHRAWKVELSDFAVNHEVWVDDESGEVLYEFSRIAHGLNRLTYDVRGGDTNAYLERSETSPPSAIAEVNNAHNYMGDTYNYFFTMFGRDSYDAAGADLVAYVNYCLYSICPYNNAFWYNGSLIFGPNFAASDDIVSHELTHGVIEHSANLIYQYQPGALNEAFADIFGESVDLLNGSGADSAAVRWDIGEDLVNFGAFRDMQDPHRFNNPAQYNDSYYYNGTADNGGVHINSGVPNRAYALAVDGGIFGGYSVEAIGLNKAAQIYYRSLTTYLTNNSQFSDAFYAISRSCDDLIGSNDITSGTCEAVCKSLLAVQLNTNGGQCYGVDLSSVNKQSIIPIIELLLLDE